MSQVHFDHRTLEPLTTAARIAVAHLYLDTGTTEGMQRALRLVLALILELPEIVTGKEIENWEWAQSCLAPHAKAIQNNPDHEILQNRQNQETGKLECVNVRPQWEAVPHPPLKAYLGAAAEVLTYGLAIPETSAQFHTARTTASDVLVKCYQMAVPQPA